MVEVEQHDQLYAPLYCQVPLYYTKKQFIQPNFFCRTFTFVEKISEDADWDRQWSSSFYLDVKTSGFVQQIEFYTCKKFVLNFLGRSEKVKRLLLQEFGVWKVSLYFGIRTATSPTHGSNDNVSLPFSTRRPF